MGEFLTDPNPWLLSILGGVISGLILHWITKSRPSLKSAQLPKSPSPSKSAPLAKPSKLSLRRRIIQRFDKATEDDEMLYVISLGGIIGFWFLGFVLWAFLEARYGIDTSLLACLIVPLVALAVAWFLDFFN